MCDGPEEEQRESERYCKDSCETVGREVMWWFGGRITSGIANQGWHVLYRNNELLSWFDDRDEEVKALHTILIMCR